MPTRESQAHHYSNGDGVRRRPIRRDPSPQIDGSHTSEGQDTKRMHRNRIEKKDSATTKASAIDASRSSSKQQQQKQKQQKQQQHVDTKHGSSSIRFLRIFLRVSVHLGCILIYLIPIMTPNEFAGPTLDESHVMAGDVQKDIHDPNATWREIFTNDYWGRPMTSPSSHKSWRPLTVLSFRFLKGPYKDLATQSVQQLTVHRLVNIICHAAAGEVVGQLATQLFDVDGPTKTLVLQLVVKILFCLHPTHVEATANAANRNHVLGTLLGVILCFPGKTTQDPKGFSRLTTPFWLFCTALLSGYLASESFIFMIPAIMVTMTVVSFTAHERIRATTSGATKNGNDSLQRFIIDYLRAMLSIAPRLILLAATAVAYYGGRWYMDTLDIPTGLIRPAENPYFAFEGMKRVRNYLYVVTVHLGKQWGSIFPKNFGGDPIGFSHEYGYDCVPEIQTWDDERLIFGVGFHFVFAILLSLGLAVYKPRIFFGMVAIHWSWTLGTLFSISGFLKVGTFISDRIVVPSSMVVSLWTGRVVQKYVTEWFWKKDSVFSYVRPLQIIFCLWWIVFSYTTVHNRAMQWMDSISLMKSALVTCPRFAKVHMEISKVYSGLYPSLLDLKKSRHHLDTARAIDPDLCDLHQQYVFLGVREGNYQEIERELPGSLLCPFTAGRTEQLWHDYWNQVLSSVPQGTPQHDQIKGRYQAATAIVQEGLQMEKAKEEAKQNNQRSYRK